MVVHHLVGCAGLLGTDNWLANSNNITAYDIQYNTHITFRHYFFFISRIVLFIAWLTSPRLSSSYNRFQTFEKILNLMRVVSFQWTFFFSRCLAFIHNHSLSLARSLSLTHFLARFLSSFFSEVKTTQRLIFPTRERLCFRDIRCTFFFSSRDKTRPLKYIYISLNHRAHGAI